MGVYIIGEKMPNNCTECFKHNKCDKYHIEIVKNEDGDFLPTYIADNCPLIEIKTPHGRLVDIDAVMNYTYKNIDQMTKIEVPVDSEYKWHLITHTIDNTSTIIEAEGES